MVAIALFELIHSTVSSASAGSTVAVSSKVSPTSIVPVVLSSVIPVASTGGTVWRISSQFRTLRHVIGTSELPHIYEPQAMTAKEAMNYETSGGKLVKVEGKVVDLLHDASLEGVSQFWLDDGSGEIANIFIDGYILSAETQKNELSSVVKMGSSVQNLGKH